MSDSTNGLVWMRTDKFVMPVVPDDLRIAPLTLAILHCASFLELSGDDTVDRDWANEALEHVTYYLQRLNQEHVTRIRTEMETIASWAESNHMHPNFIDLAKNFTVYFGLEPEN